MRAVALVSAFVLLAICVPGARGTLGRPSMRAHTPVNCGKLEPRRELGCARRQLRRDRAALHTGTKHHSPGYWRWRVKVARRWVRQAHARLERPPLRFLALWLCIHHGESGSWDTNTGNGYYGGLQMTSPWGTGDYYVYRADLLSPYWQMRKAETGYRENGYSLAWLSGQWYHPECFRYAA